MYENDYMYAIERNPDYLAHYGIRGMKWGVRKAIKSGNAAKLGRQYAKAQKKLAKLEKRAGNTGKYARRAALMGAGAAAAGGLAAAGTGGVSRLMNAASYGMSKGALGVGQVASRLGKAMTARGIRGGGRLQAFGQGAQSLGLKGATKVGMAGNAVKTWGNSNSIGNIVGDHLIRQGAKGTAAAVKATYGPAKLGQTVLKGGKRIPGKSIGDYASQNSYKMGIASTKAGKYAKGVSNDTIARIGAGAIGAGLAIGAARNAYKAATAKRKAEKFRSAMNEAFRGTQYANGGNRQGKKRRR